MKEFVAKVAEVVRRFQAVTNDRRIAAPIDGPEYAAWSADNNASFNAIRDLGKEAEALLAAAGEPNEHVWFTVRLSEESGAWEVVYNGVLGSRVVMVTEFRDMAIKDAAERNANMAAAAKIAADNVVVHAGDLPSGEKRKCDDCGNVVDAGVVYKSGAFLCYPCDGGIPVVSEVDHHGRERTAHSS